jgi:uncharacterized protein
MRVADTDLQLSASDIVNFAGCNHATLLDLRVAKEGLTPPQDSTSDLLRRKGLDHEAAVLEQYRSSGRKVSDLSGVSWRDRQYSTNAAMRLGVDIVYQGVVSTGRWLGITDFLEKIPAPSDLGDYSYEVVDTKLARTAQPKHLLQLSLYNMLLFDIQKLLPLNAHLILGDGRKESFRSLDSKYYTIQIQKRLELFIDTLPPTMPEPCGHCAMCRWVTQCEDDWHRTRHLCLVANIRSNQIAALRASGISTIDALASAGRDAHISGMQPGIIERLCAQAELQTYKENTGNNKYELLPIEPGKGFDRLPLADECDLYFDMEGDPLVSGGLEYLFGVFHGLSAAGRFLAFWGHNRSEEKAAFERTVDFFTQHIATHPSAHIYHYAPYEVTAMRRLSTLHGTREAEVDDLLRNERFVDLYRVVREGIRVSEPRYSIKNLEHFYAEKREGEVTTAGESIEVYEEWRATQEQRLLDQIERYNEQDCRSTKRLHEWLLVLRPEASTWREDSEHQRDEETSQRQTDAEKRVSDYTARLLGSVSQKDIPYAELVSQLLEFHRREAKPKYWAMFDRRDSTTEELIDDSECIGGLFKDTSMLPYKDKRSIVYSYRFPPQDFKFAVGDGCLCSLTLRPAGTIIYLDEEAGVVRLKIGANQPPLPDSMSIIPTGPIDAVVLREAIYRFADAVITGSERYRAVIAMLRRERPRLTIPSNCTSLIREGENELSTSIRIISSLDDSALIIQGPPGSGKTYTAAHSIIHLISQGRRVGVSSNSHKAIGNLLAEIVRVGREKSISVQGIQKCSTEDQFFLAPEITNTLKNPDSLASFNLVAGTAWLFARPEYDQQLDYLFVDEAGQMSLANVVAIGTSANNLVLVGDSMQLAQPTQGVHPGDSGQSVLEFLMQEHSTVPDDRGIFLGTSRRMHSDVCGFISDAFYESRLRAETGNDRQHLVLSKSADKQLKPTGICFLEVEHEGCAQRSEAEADKVKDIFNNLLTQSWVNRDGIEAAISEQDILVVSPYNMQVNLLREVLPNGARVGTVDKFQGQQAPVVIVSFATSTCDDAPRGLDFLFSRNRLNVAISRAQCLAIITANPKLLDASCRTVEQVRMVNALCWAKHFSDSEKNDLANGD